jgi:WD40 repeat protein
MDGRFVASGELALNPAIHIWSRRTLESLAVIKGLHSNGVHLLQFTNENKFLVTCGLTNPSAIIIYEWEKNEVVISTSIHAPT